MTTSKMKLPKGPTIPKFSSKLLPGLSSKQVTGVSSAFSKSVGLLSTARSARSEVSKSEASGAETVFSNPDDAWDQVSVQSYIENINNEEDLATGMRKKWERHFRGRCTVCAQLLILVGLIAIMLIGALWSQLLYTYSFNSRVLFEAVHDWEDQYEHLDTYKELLHAEWEPASAVHSFHVFHVKNPADIVELGYKPDFVAKGPFAYEKKIYRYDVEFSGDDSHTVTFKQWHYFEPITDPEVCYTTHFKMDKVEYAETMTDCRNGECHCVDDEATNATVLNSKFYSLLEEYHPDGIYAVLTQTAFSIIEELLTGSFVDSVKNALLPLAMQDVYNYRKMYQLPNLLTMAKDLLEAQGIDAAAALLRDHNDDEYTCAPVNVLYQDYCPWGTAVSVLYAGTVRRLDDALYLDAIEADALLNGTGGFPTFFDVPEGIHLWIAAGFHYGLLDNELNVYPDDAEAAMEELSAAFAGLGACTGDECEAKVYGLCLHLFNIWKFGNYIDDWVVSEYLNPPADTPICSVDHSTCDYSPPASLIERTNHELASLIMSTTNADNSNDLSIYVPANWDMYGDIQKVCKMEAAGDDTSCENMEDETYYRNEYFPELLKEGHQLSANYSALYAHWTIEDYRDLTCDWIDFFFTTFREDWGWYQDQLVFWLNDNVADASYNFTVDTIPDLGYAQWGTGGVTYALYGVRSVRNVKRQGIWIWGSAEYQESFIEFGARASKRAYPHNMFSIAESMTVLRMMANTSDAAQNYRAHVMRASTTVEGDGENFTNGVGAVGDVAFVEENPGGNFTYLYTDPYFTAVYDAVSVVAQSDPVECEALETMYYDCLNRITEGNTYLTRCDSWQTILSNPAYGIQCDPNQIVGLPHPQPLSRGNILSHLMEDMTYEVIFRAEQLICLDTGDCDYMRGGLYTNQKVRNILFDGYVDPVVLRIVNTELLAHDLQMVCNHDRTLGTSDFCVPIADNDCTDLGINITVRSTGEHVYTFSRTENPHAWFANEFTVDVLGDRNVTVRNPAFALHRGGLSKNITFQKKMDCDSQYMHSTSAVFSGCETRVHTGRGDLDRINKYEFFKGNSTMEVTANGRVHISTLELEAAGQGRDAPYFGLQFKPFLWEGFASYPYSYLLRDAGNDNLGEEDITMYYPEHLLRLNMVRHIPTVVEPQPALEYPVRFAFVRNESRELSVRLNRFVASEDAWRGYFDVAGNDMTDLYGMPYQLPIGMAPTRALNGIGSFVSTPHHYGNAEWGGVEYIQFKGLDPEERAHKTFVDVDPVSGRPFRTATRLQHNVRVERNSLFPKMISSQGRCEVPTREFNALGYGCFMYHPIYWVDDQVAYDEKRLREYTERYKEEPDNAFLVLLVSCIGGAAGVLIGGVINYIQHRRERKFKNKVYVD
uniref:Uncharacterized protein n=2 Tax=Phaeomonas parva TaxID=124430 RepID=A0A7S1XWL1_9STRA|mmetsp:Transcript_3928/g.11384  ORF Transcript_3928/g.11384 Transcript_3928/m.11384 type:complete len:1392 (+) Transcript_3928:240-4415(+)|eukprot:CAMPEP_0118880054 /NCGR_PEP_ID=MMETSP1163-20130328/19683_1 /TAXON_ID=124430 /ORGANISM="Phaeomonas parva, Strain CCMP2877" /LENGTH=1391 /DNA_ID=CAMNT_0006816333 /DNA_START=192 /DNA_END=4367 /DNA_ORIENTATION=-